jgi:hypothetical protein
MNFENLIIHIGMPKAASTLIQNNFFQNLNNVNYICFTPDRPITPLNEELRKLLLQKGNINQKTRLIELLSQYCNTDFPTIISNENILIPFSEKGIYNEINRDLVAMKLATFFPGAKILLVVRNQISFLQSMYSQILHNNNSNITLSFKSFIKSQIILARDEKSNLLATAKYDEIIQLYQAYFKEVKILVLEDAKHNFKEIFENKLADFFQIPKTDLIGCWKDGIVNGRRNYLEIKFNHFMKKLLKLLSSFGNPQRILPNKIREATMTMVRKIIHNTKAFEIDTEYDAEDLEYIRGYYASGNTWLANYLKTDLSKYGYPLK